MDLGHAHVLYICNNVFDTGAAKRFMHLPSITERAN